MVFRTGGRAMLIGCVEVEMNPCNLVQKRTVQKVPSSVAGVKRENVLSWGACHFGKGESTIVWMSMTDFQPPPLPKSIS